MGPLQVSRCSFRQRHAHAWFQFQTMDRGKIHRRRPVNPPVPSRHNEGILDRQAHSLQTTSNKSGVVWRRRHMDNHVNAQRDRCANRYDVQLPVYVLGVLQLQKGTRTCIRGARTVCRNHHSSSAMAGQPRLRQQACGRHRFGCNCCHHCSVNGKHCLACDHGAAFANVCCGPP